jgi:hypothetical protein
VIAVPASDFFSFTGQTVRALPGEQVVELRVVAKAGAELDLRWNEFRMKWDGTPDVTATQLDGDGTLDAVLVGVGRPTRIRVTRPGLYRIAWNSAPRGCFVPDDTTIELLEGRWTPLKVQLVPY